MAKQRVHTFKKGRIGKNIDTQINDFLEKNSNLRITMKVPIKYLSYASNNNDSEQIEKVLVVFDVE